MEAGSNRNNWKKRNVANKRISQGSLPSAPTASVPSSIDIKGRAEDFPNQKEKQVHS